MPARHLRIHLVCLPACLVSLMLVAGCSSSSETTEPEDGSNGQGQAAGNSASAAGGTSRGGLVTTGAGGKTIIDGIPVDVWFTDPLAVYSQSGSVAASPVTPQPGQTTNEPPTETPTQDPAPAEPPKAASVAWDKIIPMEFLDAEIKSVRNFLTPTLQTVGSYNREVLQIPTQAMTMSALAQVALNHPGDALWKDNAAALRDLSYELANAADGPGRGAFEASTLEFEKILLIFNGSTPDLDEEPDPEATFSDKVDRGPIMKRIDQAHKWLTSNTPAASSLEDSKEKAMHETVVLGALLKACGDESYLFTDEPDYQKHTSEFMAATEQMRDAIEANNYDSFKEGLNVVSRKCGECHRTYRD